MEERHRGGHPGRGQQLVFGRLARAPLPHVAAGVEARLHHHRFPVLVYERALHWHDAGVPQQARDHNSVHFYCERVRKGIRWRLYLPGNDPRLNTINPEQLAANRSNVDFKPLIDHFSAIEYSTK